MNQDRTLSRRGLLSGAAAGAAAVSLRPWAGTAAAAARRRSLGPIGPAEMWRWHEMVSEGGPRLTGSPAHDTYIEFLAGQLEHRGFFLHRDPLTFNRWAPQTWSLVINATLVPLAFYWPYSGITPADGVTASLAYVGAAPVTDWSAAKGKIAVVDVPCPPLPASTLFTATGRNSPDAASPAAEISLPSISDVLVAPNLSDAAAAGALGVIALRSGVSDGLAADQYSPFTTPYYDCPAVWTLPSSTATVRDLAIAGATATLTMAATLTMKAPTQTLWAILPGSDPTEAITINTHTDGPNVPEESGGLGLLAIADHFRRIPRSRRRRTLIFAFVTGHFQLPQFQAPGGSMASSLWMAAHPELFDGSRYRTVAALTVEHMGCMEWNDNLTHTAYGPTGAHDPAYTYATTSTMRTAYLQGAAGTANDRTFSCLPTALYFGEGAPFYAAKIPTVSLIPGPSYLTAAPRDGSLSKLNPAVITGQIQSFINVVDNLNRVNASAMGTPTGLTE
jgi:hypothetical protein